MKPIDILDEIIGNPIKVKILRHLVKGFEGRTGRALAQIANVSPPTALKPLEELLREGILTKMVIGKSHSFSLNRKNIVVEKGIIPLFRLEANLLKELAEKLKKSLPKEIDTAVWFGSIARGEATSQSDWDILILCPHPTITEKIHQQLLNKIPEWSVQFSSRLDIQVMTTKVFQTKFLQGNSFARNVYEDYSHSQIDNPLFGESLTILLGGRHDKKNPNRAR